MSLPFPPSTPSVSLTYSQFMISFSLIIEIYKYPEYKLQPAQSIQYYLDVLCPRADELVLDSHEVGWGIPWERVFLVLSFH